ncbi:GNAT family N-acetyltransferase [Paraglaciecola hydrolytica]|uniref:GNAT family N-acetyltransferase n=1 Tax=Paraglaciecola hydrolytica TaxID=1799789 RepID=UPI0008394BB9|nr:GNAT family N-acetyltransferase [Paraglaciecola hydrolytica]
MQQSSRENYQLVNATEQHLLSVKTWFNSTAQIFTWGGPNMVYPMADNDFLDLMQAEHLNSYVLTDNSQQMLAFGQFYMRLGRHHLGRLGVNPSFRGQGLAKPLIKKLLALAHKQQNAQGASLFVFADNLVALQCYASLGFELANYPDPMPGNMQNCLYMVLEQTSLLALITN